MSKIERESYIWAYFTKDINNEEGKCKICSKVYALRKDYFNVRRHIKGKHNFVPSNTKKLPYSIIQKHQTKCDICNKRYNIKYYESDIMKHHLKNEHNIEIENQNWLLNYKYTKSNETMECIYCKRNFQNDVKHRYFNAIKHLIDVHHITGISLEFRSTGNTEDVAVSSGCQQPIYSWNPYGISSLGFSTNATGTLTTSHNNFSYLDINAENVAVSSGCQQPMYSLHYNVSSSSSSSSTNAMDTSTTSYPQQPIHDYPLDNLHLEMIENIENIANQPIHDCNQLDYEVDYCAIEDMLK